MSGPIFQLPPLPSSSPLSHVLVSWSANLIGIDALDVSFGVMLVHKPNQSTGRRENQYAGCLTLFKGSSPHNYPWVHGAQTGQNYTPRVAIPENCRPMFSRPVACRVIPTTFLKSDWKLYLVAPHCNLCV